MVKNTLETLIGLVGLTVALTGCPGDDTGSDTNNTTTGVNTTGMDSSTGGDTTSEPPATDDGASSSSEGGGDSTTGDPVECDPPCPAGEECTDGACFPIMCDPPCGAEEMCVAGVCEPIPPNNSDYGPCDMCAPGEMPVSIGMIEGCFCSPMCDGMSCPTPNEGTASAQCILELMAGAGPTQCALICMTTEDCPPGATCEDAGGGSVCMHPSP